ncbi:RNA polymerase sigma factor [Solirubrobacter sp. CPCC 204708]|uniref:RNA polymerase sigma factor n=1 Tax=Solirubrobacter deserti TaxID=2282478 RepID=A0ABT4RRB9_9ACTN|nr:RNA polymerase sigma factor [Solirubrobacter deserti]MBE2314893.1 RNA polymerase sigma factor [Solirubrobacter deserti]MDA0141120.1 RNA polymerase sigma factor [Solirubrobacter deserti]
MGRLDIDALYGRHGEELLLFLTRRTADPQVALDLWAETFAQAIAASRRFRGRTGEEAAAWLYTIARRQLARYYERGRTEQRAVQRLRFEREPASPNLLAELAERAGLSELRAELAGALAQLSPGVREAVHLRVVDDVPYAELAGRLGMSEQAARTRVSRGLARLAGLLDAATIEHARSS